MRKLNVKRVLTLLGACIIAGGVFVKSVALLNDKAATVSAAELECVNEEVREVVQELFEITKVVTVRNHTEVYGEILGSTVGETGEGIYLDNTYGFDLSDFEEGQWILVTYDKEDYYEEIWDNILDIQILK